MVTSSRSLEGATAAALLALGPLEQAPADTPSEGQHASSEASGVAEQVARTPLSPTPALTVDSATRGTQILARHQLPRRQRIRQLAGCQVGVLWMSPKEEVLPLAKLIVGVARNPPCRVDTILDRRLQSASSLGEVLAAAIAPVRTPLHESEEMISLRDEVSRCQDQVKDAEDKLAIEFGLRTKAEMFCTQASCDFNAASNTLHSVRLENIALSRQLALANAAIATHAESMAQLGLRVKNAEADAAAAMRTIRKDRERFKAGMLAFKLW
ncbi:hypothetical protein PHPALM_30150 [Phytophthora palmivora]|uniref:Uncharacterized protein n=1 Tax=Phytophthora palmivora TaxID=4796 RepID=A0A2P4X5V7_9STRA|nr:hypothetical protein PHPALM_30150 [Phytophthora palmivora]